LETGVPARLSARDGRRFGLEVGAAFLVLAGVSSWRGHSRSAVVLSIMGCAFVSAGLLVPGRMTSIRRVWMRSAEAISKVTTPLVMGALYFLVLTPMGVLLRVCGHRPLASRKDGPAWIARHPTQGGRSDLKRQF
jgi:ABC-type uncharacterized transport system permease subunit